jgi:DNA-binding response OmpR family regulator
VIVLWRRPGIEDRRLDLGADDYVEKPFAMGELLARMRLTPSLQDRLGRNALRSRLS